VEVNKTPLQYMTNGATRIQIRAVRPLGTLDEFTPPSLPPLAWEDDCEVEEGEKVGVPNALNSTYKPALHVDLDTYKRLEMAARPIMSISKACMRYGLAVPRR
jgi:hypothetical protein